MKIYGKIEVEYIMRVGERLVLWENAETNMVELTLIEGEFSSIDSVPACFLRLAKVGTIACNDGAYLHLDFVKRNDATVEKWQVRLYEDDERVLKDVWGGLRIGWLDEEVEHDG